MGHGLFDVKEVFLLSKCKVTEVVNNATREMPTPIYLSFREEMVRKVGSEVEWLWRLILYQTEQNTDAEGSTLRIFSRRIFESRYLSVGRLPSPGSGTTSRYKDRQSPPTRKAREHHQQ